MLSALIEQATLSFYQWEILGRGWLLAEEPIDLEPPFTPFFGHQRVRTPAVDDAERHTLLSALAQWWKPQKQLSPPDPVPEIDYQPISDQSGSADTVLTMIIPKGFKGSTVLSEQLLAMLTYSTERISFEIEARAEKITLRWVCHQRTATYIKGQCRTYFPQLAFIETALDPYELPDQDKPFQVMDYGLVEEFMRPLALLGSRGIDPYTSMVSVAEQLEPEETILVQVLFNGVVNPWESSILRSVATRDGKPFFQNAPEMLPLAKEKITAPLMAVTVRAMAQAANVEDTIHLFDKLQFALIQSSRSTVNQLTPLADDHYDPVQRMTDIAFRTSRRTGMLLNVKELATLVHIPDAALSPKLLVKERKTKKTPPIALGHPFVLGTNTYQGITTEVSVAAEQRFKHTHIIGATGTGKSTLLLTMIAQDIRLGNGVAVLDPHGDLIEKILEHIPQTRLEDVVVIDPSESEYPVGFNILKAGSELEKEILAADLVAVFKRLSTSWGDQMNAVLANAILALLESPTTGTLADLRRFLIEKRFRETILKTVTDPSIRYYWHKEYPLLKTSSIGPILTRLDTFLRPRMIRNMVCQQKSVDVAAILNNQKILLVKLSQGLIGAENSYLLGTVLVSKIHQAALARQASEKREDFFVYIDEFQHFMTPSMSQLLSGARKYHVGLILAHQDMQQLQRHDSELTNSIIANAGARICFRVGEGDARKLAEGFSGFEPQDLQNLGVGQAVVRLERPEYDCSLDTAPLANDEQDNAAKTAVLAHSRSRYGTPRQVVEEQLRLSMEEIEEETPPPTVTKQQPAVPTKQEALPKEITLPQVVLSPIVDEERKEEEQVMVKKKEESQHRYLQNLIKQCGEASGYKATLEAMTPDQKGKVDVLLEGYGSTIAVEVSVTTTTAWELHNIRKCIAAGYTQVIVCTPDKKVQTAIASTVQTAFEKDVLGRIQVLEPEQLIAFLEQGSAVSPPNTTTIKGYEVKLEYNAVNLNENKRKQSAIAKIVLDALRKLNK